jgi:hypothetical protein
MLRRFWAAGFSSVTSGAIIVYATAFAPSNLAFERRLAPPSQDG